MNTDSINAKKFVEQAKISRAEGRSGSRSNPCSGFGCGTEPRKGLDIVSNRGKKAYIDEVSWELGYVTGKREITWEELKDRLRK